MEDKNKQDSAPEAQKNSPPEPETELTSGEVVETEPEDKLPEDKDTKGEKKKICANVDLYSGLIYDMLRIPQELFTPLFMSARIAGWSAHRIEELTSGSRIMRPAYKNVSLPRRFVPIADRIDNHAVPAEYIPPEER